MQELPLGTSYIAHQIPSSSAYCWEWQAWSWASDPTKGGSIQHRRNNTPKTRTIRWCYKRWQAGWGWKNYSVGRVSAWEIWWVDCADAQHKRVMNQWSSFWLKMEQTSVLGWMSDGESFLGMVLPWLGQPVEDISKSCDILPLAVQTSTSRRRGLFFPRDWRHCRYSGIRERKIKHGPVYARVRHRQAK